MGNIKPLDVGELWLKPGGYEEKLCLYVTAMKPPSAGWYQLSIDLGLSKDDGSLLFAITMAGWERAPHVAALERFSVEVVAKLPIDLNYFPLANDPLILFELVKQVVVDGTHEICRQRVFRHDEKVSKGDMVRVSALDPGVPFIEKSGNDESLVIRVPPGYSDYQKVKEMELLTPGMVLIRDSKRPFEPLIKKPRKPTRDRQAPDFTHFLECYEQGFDLLKNAKKTLKTLERCSVEEQYNAINNAYKEIDPDLIRRMLRGEEYLSTTSYLAAEWAARRCGVPADRAETLYPVTYLMQLVTKQREKKNRKQVYFVKSDE